MKNCLTREKSSHIVLTIVLLSMMLMLLSGTASAQEEGVYLEPLEHIAEDIEEIHEDMHKVAFSLRLISYSSIGIFLVLLGQLFVLSKKS